MLFPALHRPWLCAGARFVGIMMTDFTGQGLIDKVIAVNSN